MDCGTSEAAEQIVAPAHQVKNNQVLIIAGGQVERTSNTYTIWRAKRAGVEWDISVARTFRLSELKVGSSYFRAQDGTMQCASVATVVFWDRYACELCDAPAQPTRCPLQPREFCSAVPVVSRLSENFPPVLLQ